VSKRVLAIIAGGLGNQIQMTAAVATLEANLGWHMEIVAGGAPLGAAELRALIPWPTHRPAWRPAKDEHFDGAVALGFGANGGKQDAGWMGIPWLNDIGKQAVRTAKSEVDVSMDACRELGIAEDDLIWHGEIDYNEAYGEQFDIVLANNYYKGTKESPREHWHVRGFPGFGSVAKGLQERFPRLSMCCIGYDDREAIAGVVDRTGIPLGDTMALIARAKVLVTTDSMAFHAAPCFDTRTFGLWTATSAVKSACPKFHHTATLIGRDDLECRKTCHANLQGWMRCKRWECQEIGIGRIVGEVAAYLEGGDV